ncbi:MAG: glycosyltransferase family 2 protein [Candidatus Omnitrophota bacterium]
MKLSVIIPAHNEEENIVNTIHRVEEALDFDFELIIVNDHSTDGTRGLVEGLFAEYPNLRIVENKGAGCFANAIRTGLCSIRTDLVVPVMGDLCDELASIKKMLAKIEEGYDIVCGSRYIKGGGGGGGSRLKGFLSSLAGWSIFYLLGLPTHDAANAFKMYRRKVIETVKTEATGFEISLELPLKAYYSGFKITEVPTNWKEREKGKSDFKIMKLLPAYLKVYLWGIKKRIIRQCR